MYPQRSAHYCEHPQPAGHTVQKLLQKHGHRKNLIIMDRSGNTPFQLQITDVCQGIKADVGQEVTTNNHSAFI